MVSFIKEMQNIDSVLMIVLLAIAVLIVICCVVKLFKAGIVLLLFLLIAPALYAVFFSDGAEYIKEITSVLTPKYSQQIQETYEQFKDKRDENFVMSIQKDTSSETLEILNGRK